MLMADVWSALALDFGIEPAAAANPGADVALQGPGLELTSYSLATTPVLHPSRVQRFASARAHTLVVTERATPAALRAAVVAGVSVLVAPPRGPVSGVLVDHAGQPHPLETDVSPTSLPTSRPGRTPWGKLALVLALLDDPAPHTQTTLAHLTGLTQARVSQSFAQLPGLVARSTHGWALTDPAAAADWVVTHYPRPATIATWLTLDDPVPATRAIAQALAAAGVDHAITGQVAADTYAPWARPDRAGVWVAQLVDLSASGCTPVAAADANVSLVVPDDPYALAAARERDGLRLADPWRTWITLVQGGDDAAADRLRRHLLDRRGGTP